MEKLFTFSKLNKSGKTLLQDELKNELDTNTKNRFDEFRKYILVEYYSQLVRM